MGWQADNQPDGIFSDHIREGQKFKLTGAAFGNKIPNKHRKTEQDPLETQTVLLTCQLDEWDAPKVLSIIGESIEKQVASITRDMLPEDCVVWRKPTKGGNEVKVLDPWRVYAEQDKLPT